MLLRLGDIPVRLCCMGILMSMLRRWIWQLNAKLLTFKCSSLGLVYHYDIIFPKGYWVIFFIHVFQTLKVTCIPNWQGIFYGVLKTAFNMSALYRQIYLLLILLASYDFIYSLMLQQLSAVIWFRLLIFNLICCCCQTTSSTNEELAS